MREQFWYVLIATNIFIQSKLVCALFMGNNGHYRRKLQLHMVKIDVSSAPPPQDPLKSDRSGNVSNEEINRLRADVNFAKRMLVEAEKALLTKMEERELCKEPRVAESTRYGFVSRSEGCRFDSDIVTQDDDGDRNAAMPMPYQYGPPANALSLALQQFNRNLRAIFGQYDNLERGYDLTPEVQERQRRVHSLTLNVTEVQRREDELNLIRQQGFQRGEDGKIQGTGYDAPALIKVPYDILVTLLNLFCSLSGSTPIEVFYLLEVVARMPYFSYISMLHLYETLGWWRRSADVKSIHFAEEVNEYHHLLLMETLGGDQRWFVRFIAQHAAIIYYWFNVLLFFTSPKLAYGFSVLLETHAVETYQVFIEENDEELAKLPAPPAVTQYYDRYLWIFVHAPTSA